MYNKWSRGIGANGDRGGYVSFTPEEGDETWELAQAMPLDVVFQSVYALVGEGYVIQFRTNSFQNMLEAVISRRTERWQDQQYLQCFCDDPAMALAMLLVRFYEDFYDQPDSIMRVLDLAGPELQQKLNQIKSKLPSSDEIDF